MNAGGLLTVLAGVLLLLPGLITALAGAALLIGPVRRWCGGAIGRSLHRGRPADRSTIDLAPGEWTQVSDPKLPDDSGRHTGD